MRITPEKKLASAIELHDGRTYYFCGTGCLLKTWLHPSNVLGVRRTEIARAMTRDYFTGQALDAARATWIAGSDVVGPMGPTIVPLRDATSVQTFHARHGGEHDFSLSELDDEKWQAITHTNTAH